MAVDPIPVINASDLLRVLVTELPALWRLLQAAGIVFLGYMLFLFIRGFLTIRTNRRVTRLEEKVDLLLQKAGIDYQAEMLKKKHPHDKKKVSSKQCLKRIHE